MVLEDCFLLWFCIINKIPICIKVIVACFLIELPLQLCGVYFHNTVIIYLYDFLFNTKKCFSKNDAI